MANKNVIPTPIAGPQQFKAQTPVPNPQAPSTLQTVVAYSFYDASTGDPISLPVVYQQFYEALYSTELLDLVATATNPANISAGAAIYTIGKRTVSRNYSAGTKLPNQASFEQVTVPVDYTKEIMMTWESLDLHQFDIKIKGSDVMLGSAFINSINTRMVKAEMLYNQIKLLKGLVDSAKINIKLTLIEPGKWEQTPDKKDYIWVPDFSIDAWRGLWYQFVNFVEFAKSSLNNSYAGLDLDQFTFLAGPRAKIMLSMFPLNYGNKTSELIENFDTSQIAGVKFKTIPFLGYSNFQANDIDEDETFDLTGVDAIFIHKEAYAYPISYGQAYGNIIPQSGNLLMLHKWRINQHGGKAIRPDLIWGIVFKRPDKP